MGFTSDEEEAFAQKSQTENSCGMRAFLKTRRTDTYTYEDTATARDTATDSQIEIHRYNLRAIQFASSSCRPNFPWIWATVEEKSYKKQPETSQTDQENNNRQLQRQLWRGGG